jgi:SAM-dependent methyltransferase
MQRAVKPELLDRLPADDRRAIQSRADLQKVNAWMGHARIMSRMLERALGGDGPQSIVDLGSGDGTLLLKIARRMAPAWKPSRVVLVDRQPVVTSATRAAFEALSWRVDVAQMDVFGWLHRSKTERFDVTIANLFLHHFEQPELSLLLREVAAQTRRVFLACEPSRRWRALAAIPLLRVIGCNDVTLHDGRISVQAGFLDKELSEAWDGGGRWRLEERHAGAFTHCFLAERL